MNKNLLIAVVVGAVAAGGAVGWFLTQGDSEPTTGVTAPEVVVDEPNESSGATSTFELTDASAATFILDEELRGQPKTVEVTSDAVVGQIQIDRDELANSAVGTILVNARSLTSDTALRDRAIRGPILDTDTFEFIEFAPTSINGLSGAALIGDELVFTIDGELTIRDITTEVTFDMTVTLVDGDTIEGFAATSVSRSAYELVIPSVPTVANVSDTVFLELSFVATP